VKRAHSPLSLNASIPVGSINYALGSFCRQAQAKAKSPSAAMGKMTLKQKAFDPAMLKITQKNSYPCGI